MKKKTKTMIIDILVYMCLVLFLGVICRVAVGGGISPTMILLLAPQ